MSFPDFSFSSSMQIILVFISAASAFSQHYFINNITLKLYDEKVKSQKKLLYIFLLSVVFYSSFIYGIYALFGFKSFSDAMSIVVILPNPLLGVLSYILAINLLGFSQNKIIGVVRQTYIFLLTSSVIGLLLKDIFFKQSEPYNYLLDAIGLVFYSALFFIVYLAGLYFLKRFRFIIRLSEISPVKNKDIELAMSLVGLYVIFFATVFIITHPSRAHASYILAIIFLILCLCLDFTISYKRMLSQELDAKNLYIGSLTNTVSSFSSLQSNFLSIMNIYGKYIDNGDILNLKLYHESLLGKTVLTVDKLNLTQKMSQNPALVSLLLKKLEHSHQQGVTLRISILCSLKEMSIEDFDLCRVLGNLLNNAIEAAALSTQKTITLLIEIKNENCKLITLSNSTQGDVDINSISTHGATTKPGHMGVGLTQVGKTLRKYGNTTLQFSYFQNKFSVYIELWETLSVT